MILGFAAAVALAATTIQAQIPGRNVNMVSGVGWPDGDPFLQRQNEPSVAASTRNPLHLLGGSNDYRTVDLPGLLDEDETGDAWLGLYKSFDGGQRWTSTLLPGFPQDQSPAGLGSPLKGYQAGADPVVRAGTNGLFYYNGLVFDRGEDGKSGIFVARFIDNNNKENGDPVAYLGTRMVATAGAGKFLDKPWMAVDIPRPGAPMCTITANNIIPMTPPTPTHHAFNGRGRRSNSHEARDHDKDDKGKKKKPPVPTPPPVGQRIPAGTIYVAYTSISGSGDTLKAEILLVRSTDCGNTFSAPITVSRKEDQINQGASITIDPRNGIAYVAYRRFGTTSASETDAIMMARLPYGAGKFDPPGRAHGFPKAKGKQVQRLWDNLFEHRRIKGGKASETALLSEFDQGSSGFSFRTNAYPTLATDATGRVYIAWAQRGYAAVRPDPVDGDSRILISTTRDAKNFTTPRPVDDTSQTGHQVMPALAMGGGKLMLVYYDLRETRANTFGKFITDANTVSGLRHTIDIRATMADPGDLPQFAPSTKVSDYMMGYRSGTGALEQLQFNPPNLPMFKQGTVPFIGDYIDITASPAFIPAGNGKWAYNNTKSADLPIFHAVWTDNRDVRPPSTVGPDGRPDWTKYTPATKDPNQPPPASIFDPTKAVTVCDPNQANAGSRNQNIYSARITGGLLAGSPGNTKPLSPELQRGFVVFAQNATNELKTFRMTVLSQPVGGRASFEQFPLPPYTASSPAPLTAIDMQIPPRSTASRTLYVTSSDPKAPLNIDVSEVVSVGGGVVDGGLESRVMLNPDIENPDIENPDIENPDIENPDIENAEVYNPDIENPDIENPDIENPDIENPDIENPDIENVVVANPDIENPDIENPDIENPDIENPDIENPDIENPDIENGAIADINWTVSNTGNTTSAFNASVFLAQASLPAGINAQLILRKVYKTPVTNANGCDLRYETRNILIANIPNPVFVTPGGGLVDPNDPSPTNGTMWLAPGEEAVITLRVFDDDTSNNLIITKADGSTVSVDPSVVPSEDITPVITQQGVNTLDAENGVTEPEPVILFPPPAAVNDEVTTTPITSVTLNVLANDSVAFGSTKIVSMHPAGLGQNMGSGANELVFMPSSGLIYAGGGRTVGVIDPVSKRLAGRIQLDPSGLPITYGLGSPQTGAVFFRRGTPGAPGAEITAIDARPGSPTFHTEFQVSATVSAAIDALGDAFTFTLSPNGRTLYLAAGSNTQQSISAIDADPASPGFGAIQWTFPLAANTITRAMAVNNGKLYITSTNNPATGGLYVLTITAPALPVKVTGVDPAAGLAINAATNLIYVYGTATSVRINVVDGNTDTLITQLSTGRVFRSGSAEDRIVIHHGTGRVLVRTPDEVLVFDGLKGSPTFNSMIAAVGVGTETGNTDLVLDEAAGVLGTISNFSQKMAFIDVTAAMPTATFVANPRSGAGELTVDPVHHRFYAALPGTVQEITALTAATAATTAQVSIFPEAAAILLNPVTNRAYLTNTTVGTGILRMAGSGSLGPVAGIAPAIPGRFTFGARYNATNQFVFANTESNPTATQVRPGSLAVLNGGTDTVTNYLATTSSPFGVGINQATGQIYVAGLNGIDPANLSGPQINGQIVVHDINNLGAGMSAPATLSGIAALPNQFISFGRHVAVNPQTGRVYVMVLGGSNTSVVYLDPTIGLAPPTATALDLVSVAGLTVDDRVEVIRVNPSNNRIYLGTDNQVTNAYHVVVLDGASHALVPGGVLNLGGHSRQHTANWIAVNPLTNRLYVADFDSDMVTMLDATTLAPLAQMDELPAGPAALALNLTEDRLYVSSETDKSISALNGATLALLSTVKLPLHVFFMEVDEVESRIYTSGGNSNDESGTMVITDVLGKLGTDVTVASVTNGAGGTTTLNADFSVTYAPNFGFSGDDTFTYTVHNHGGDATGTVTVHVVPTNFTPVAVDDAYGTSARASAADPSLVIAAPGLLGNDATGGGPVTISATTPDHGTVVVDNDGSFTYTVAPGYTGPDSFQYQVSAGAISNPGTVAITVMAPATFVVTNTNDSGAGSLRAAITASNGNVGLVDHISFNINGGDGGPFTIIPSGGGLPAITDPVVIDGYTQGGASPNTLAAGTNAVIQVEVRGTSAGAGATGFNVTSGNSTIRGLAISGFNGQAILLDGAVGGNLIEGNFIGTNITGTLASANTGGVVSQSPSNVIGGTTLAARNLISGNGVGSGIRVSARTAAGVVVNSGSGTAVQNNLLGTNAAGTAAIGNFGSGGVLVTVPNVTIGGVSGAERNIISGNTAGIDSFAQVIGGVVLSVPSGMVVQGNYIGTTADGLAAIPNTGGGIRGYGANSFIGGSIGTTPGGPCTGACNVISGNGGVGGLSLQSHIDATSGAIYSQATGTVVRGNYLGLNAAGTALLTNNSAAILSTVPLVTIGGPNAGDGNLIAGALSGSGVSLSSQQIGPTSVAGGNSVVQGNTFGLSATGARLGARGLPISVGTATNQIVGNVIAGNGTGAVPTTAAISLSRTANTNAVKGNFIGTNAGGDPGLANFGAGITIFGSANTIGGNTPADRNVIVGGNDIGVFVSASPATTAASNVIQGNYIGVKPDGVTAQGTNLGLEIYTTAGSGTVSGTIIGGSTPGARNVIASNVFGGISILGATSVNTIIRGNYVGVAADGTTARGNGGGINISGAPDNMVGGPNAGDGNIIAFSTQAGVAVQGNTAVRNQILGNAIHDNSGLGIDLGNNGPTANDIGDGDTGPNDLLNFPVLNNASNSPGPNTQVDVDLSTFGVGPYTIEFFATKTCDASGFGEASRLVGRQNIAQPGTNGVTMNEAVEDGDFLTATATDAAGNTSEFSACTPVTAPPGPVPEMSTHFVPGQAGGTANTNFAGALGIDPVTVGILAAGQTVRLTASGSVSWYADRGNLSGPDGRDGLNDPSYLAPGLPGISLVARIGTGPWQFVGRGPTILSGPGVLQLAVNDNFYGANPGFDEANTGGFDVSIFTVQQWTAGAGGNDAFYSFVPTHTTFTAAEAVCVAAGGHLASVHSANENHFLSLLADPGQAGFITSYLGGVLSVSAGWAWTDGSPWDYANWRAGEPSGDGNAVQLWPDNNGVLSGWNDLSDSIILSDGGYLCNFAPNTYILDARSGGLVNTNDTPSGLAPMNVGVFLNPGEAVTITASGTIYAWSPPDTPYGPNGNGAFGLTDLAPGLSGAGLVARVGSGPWQFVGAGPTVVSAGVAGLVEIAVNDSQFGDNSGSWSVVVTKAAHTAWSGTGSGTVTVPDVGVTSGTPTMTYQNNGFPNFSGAWEFSTVAAAGGTINLAYGWNGFHSFYQVRAGLDVFVNRGGSDVYVGSLIDAGPEDCGACNPPSGGFYYSGPATVSVLPGDTYGFRLRGSHQDGTYALQGTFTVSGTP
ncbi:MAG: Ig-like domain-containing protein [Vicinamibacterales bacterium]